MVRFVAMLLAALVTGYLILFPVTSASAVSEPEQSKRISFPIAIDVPAIDVRADDLLPLELDYKGELEVPPLDQPWRAGWYVDGSRPGETGMPAVIAAHVNGPVMSGDTRLSVPGLFYQLKELKPGDKAHILRSDYSEVSFEVYKVEKYSKAQFPSEAVYGETEAPELRLITCGGKYNYDNNSFEDNYVAYLRMVP
jgi:hypothetical protein